MVSYADLIRDVLDYRAWYEFHLLYERDGSRERADGPRFNKFSGGKRPWPCMFPLRGGFRPISKGRPHCPMLLALDEAFAGVDERNISAMFELVGVLDFDYIMNSQALWGCYANVKSLILQSCTALATPRWSRSCITTGMVLSGY
ncbi:MAG: SbcC/MukB-like Walker B domain-containing protein [Dysosmobacter welbionis]